MSEDTVSTIRAGRRHIRDGINQMRQGGLTNSDIMFEVVAIFQSLVNEELSDGGTPVTLETWLDDRNPYEDLGDDEAQPAAPEYEKAGWENISTGGGCDAYSWWVDRDAGTYLLVTEVGGAEVPEFMQDGVLMGFEENGQAFWSVFFPDAWAPLAVQILIQGRGHKTPEKIREAAQLIVDQFNSHGGEPILIQEVG